MLDWFREPSERRDETRTSLPVRLPVASSQPLCSPETKEQRSCQPLENLPFLQVVNASPSAVPVSSTLRIRTKPLKFPYAFVISQRPNIEN